jgi:hypothetical protein
MLQQGWTVRQYLDMAREAARTIIADDPQLTAPTMSELRRRAQRIKTQLDQFRE